MTDHSPTAQPSPIVYVIDDDVSVRTALADLLDSVGLNVCVFGSTREFLEHDMADVPGCLILDVRMPGQSGMAFHEQMHHHGLQLPVIFITGHGDIPMGVRAIKQGAIEFLSKPFREQDLLDAIHQGIRLDCVRREEAIHTQELLSRWATLTPGERTVMALVVQGQLNKQIAAALHLSEITVKVRRGNIMRKMHANTFADLVRLADKIYALQATQSSGQ